jgi:uncharacterized membrane protein YhaH (DUF805 family)
MSKLGFFFSFRGRLSRFGYWSVIFAGLLVGVAVYIILAPFNSWVFGTAITTDTLLIELFWLAIAAFFLATYLSILSACVRRLHDLDFSGWWALLLLIISFPALVILGCIPGDTGKNRFGPAPTS